MNTQSKNNNYPFGDMLFEQMTAISKASAYDAIAPKLAELEKENIVLRGENAMLKIQLKGREDMVKALQDFINEVRPEGATNVEMANPEYNWSAIENEITDEMEQYHEIKNRNEKDDISNVL